MVVLLMILAVPLMGSDCAVAARFGGPVSPPPETPPPPPSGGGGGVIIVTSGDSLASTARAEAVRIERALVATALAASVWTSPDFERLSATPESLDSTAILAAEAIPPRATEESGLVLSIQREDRSPSSPVPEPTGLLLFASGLCVASIFGRRRPIELEIDR